MGIGKKIKLCLKVERLKAGNKVAKFFLTRRAYRDLLAIEDYSLGKWGETQTDLYMSELYEAFANIARKPEIGRLRQDRSYPFYMAQARLHFAIYKPVTDGVIIATVLHGRQDIETIIRNMTVTLAHEIKEMDNRR